MNFLTYNYLGEKVWDKDGKRYIQNFDGWLIEQQTPRFYKAKNKHDLKLIAQSYVRWQHLHHLTPEKALEIIIPEYNNHQLQDWLKILENEMLWMTRKILPNKTPNWIKSFKSDGYDLYFDNYLNKIFNNFPFEECKSKSLHFSIHQSPALILANAGSFGRTKRSYLLHHYHQEDINILNDDWLFSMEKFKGVAIFNGLANKQEILRKKFPNVPVYHFISDYKPIVSLWVFDWPHAEKFSNLKSENKTIELNKKTAPNYLDNTVYKSKSKKLDSESSLPSYLNWVTQKSLNDLEEKIGDVDEYVKDKTCEEIWANLSAEQVDAAALAIHQLENESGFILGDETGKGKGRILASIIWAAKKQNKNVVFLTEKHHLFTDLFRDLGNIKKELPDAYILHKEAVIYDTQGQILKKAKISEADFTSRQDLILSTYSQFNRSAVGKGKAKNGKLFWLLDHLDGQFGNGWLILDEAHNASGDSNISENVGKMLKKTLGVVYSSATFAKSEKNLDLYKKAIPTNAFGFQLIKKILKQEKYAHLREIVTLSMADNGQFIRREHVHRTSPEKRMLELTDEKKEYLNAFSKIWNEIFILTNLQNKHFPQKEPWTKLGRSLQRTVAEFLILLKIDGVTDLYNELMPEFKPIWVLENTLEASLKHLVLNEADWEEKSEKGDNLILPAPAPLWKNKFKKIIEEEIDKDLWLCMSPEEKSIAEKSIASIESYLEVIPPWVPSPIDLIKNQIKEIKGATIDELSGRQYEIVNQKVISKKPLERTKVVYQFNNKELDSLVLTRTGSTGISLHAGVNFKDQRSRCLVELEIPKNPAERIQFWGRVSRKDEVSRSKVVSLLLNCPAEHRWWIKQNVKYEKASAHMGKTSEQELDFLSPEADTIVYEWLFQNQALARSMGIWNLSWDNKSNLADRVLSRAILLSLEKQKEIFEILDYGLSLLNKSYSYKNWLGKHSESFNPHLIFGFPNQQEGLMANYVYLKERVFQWELNTNPQDVENLIKTNAARNDLKHEIIDDWRRGTDFYQRASKLLSTMNIGNCIFTMRPLDQKAEVGVITNFHAQSPYLANTVGIEVWFKGMPEPVILSLWELLQDKYLKIKADCFKADWFNFSGMYPIIYNSLEGNPFLAAWWGAKRKIGRSVNIIDKVDGIKNILLLPRRLDYQYIQNLNLDMLDPHQVSAFLRAFPKEKLYLSGEEEKLELFLMDDQMYLSFDPNYYKTIDMDFMLLRNLKKPKKMNNRIVHITNKNNLPYILHLLEAKQIYWNIKANNYNWYIEYFKNFNW